MVRGCGLVQMGHCDDPRITTVVHDFSAMNNNPSIGIVSNGIFTDVFYGNLPNGRQETPQIYGQDLSSNFSLNLDVQFT
jgi:hypothetical protein